MTSRVPAPASSPSTRAWGGGDKASGAGKVKLMCSYGGLITPRPFDGALRYVGGHTRLINISRAASFGELLQKVEALDEASAASGGVVLRYQLPGVDLDSLITVSGPVDYKYMMDEYEELAAAAPDRSTKLRVFLFRASGTDAGPDPKERPDARHIIDMLVEETTNDFTRPDVKVKFKESAEKSRFAGVVAPVGDMSSLRARAWGGDDEAFGVGKVKLMCSYGGRIAPRPMDGALRYMGGQTRLISIPRVVSFGELLWKVETIDEASAASGGVLLMYQLPGEDLDSLITVSGPEDYDNMMEEYERIVAIMPDGSAKLRVFLFPKKRPDEGNVIDMLVETETTDDFTEPDEKESVDEFPRDEQTMELNILERVVSGSEEPSHLDLSLLQSITDNFSEERKIGVGGCGEVYKGILRNGVVAVKRLFKSRTIKDKMFHREVQSLITARQENIVRFLGYCSFTEERVFIFEGRTIMADIRERLLCFEYISNGNLENHLTDELRGLEWHTRYKIIVGICKGLLYLHKEKDIVQMDLKPANILLDDHMVPKITDFGLSRFDNNSHTKTTSRFISLGYCAPEYLYKGKSSSKSDIYSLGVVIKELVTGTKNEPNLTKVLRRWRHRWTKSSEHPHLGYQQVTKCLKLAQRCIQTDPTSRPDIVDITQELNAMDSKDDQFQEIPCLDDILGIEPLEIRFPFELDPPISHSIELTNDTDGYIAFMTKARSRRFRIEPDKGIVPPGSKCSVTITMQAQVNALPKNHYTEEITLLSTKIDGGLAAMHITTDVFIEEEGNVVDEVNVMVVFDEPQSFDEES